MRSLTLILAATIIPLIVSQSSSELDLILSRRQSDLALSLPQTQIAKVGGWLSTQKSDGTWGDVDYTSGCAAQRANWPIQEHWNRLLALSSVYTGLNPGPYSNLTGSAAVLNATSKGLDWWFERDYTSDDCIGLGGAANATCPCGTPGLWNTNWFGQVILIPQLLTSTCLLLHPHLSPSQLSSCTSIPLRAYTRRDQFINGLGYLTGANTINVMQNSVSLALYTGNETILEDALARAMGVVTFSDGQAEDGIHRDGSFLQHSGILYNGNYGKDLLNAFIQLEGEVIGTSFAANSSTKTAFATDVRGGEWMIYVERETGREYWDLNTVGRFIAFPTKDLQANADINFNVTKLAAATSDFTGADDLSDVVRRLGSNGTEALVGNKMFWAADYMVHRREGWMMAGKSLSNRSHNTEYTNSANPFGYHLGMGTLFTYITGAEYKDIQAAWDWNLIPGVTSILNTPKLNSSIVGFTGKTTFVGGVSDGWVGTSVMDFRDPYDGSLSYRKATFFLDDSVLVTISGVTKNSSFPVITTLDNKRLGADKTIWVDGKAITNSSTPITTAGKTLCHDHTGYLSYGSDFNLTLFAGNRTGNWTAISTSTAGNQTSEIFSAYITHLPGNGSYSYAIFPASDPARLEAERVTPGTVPLVGGEGVSAVAGRGRWSVVFWPSVGEHTATVSLGQVGWSGAGVGNITLTSDSPSVFGFATRIEGAGQVLVITLADPTQALKTMKFELSVTGGAEIGCSSVGGDGCEQVGEAGVKFEVALPTGGLSGSTVFREVLLNL